MKLDRYQAARLYRRLILALLALAVLDLVLR